MAPIKFEENIKDKLDKRKLKPSPEAWSKLSKRMDSGQEKRTSKNFWWLGIAASIVGILFVVSQFVFDKPVIINAPEIVDSPEIIENNKDVELVNQEINVLELNKNEVIANASIKEKESFESKIEFSQPTFKENNVIAQNNLEPQIVEDDTVLSSIVLKEITFEEQKIQDVVAQVQALTEDNKEVTNETIDALLFEAQREITLKQLINKKTGMVDADLLLQDVEAEVDQSFRSKVFEALRNSYNSVKTAVANRNE